MEILEKTRRLLWLFVELGFLTILSVDPDLPDPRRQLGVFVKSVTDNMMKFAAPMPTPEPDRLCGDRGDHLSRDAAAAVKYTAAAREAAVVPCV